MRLRAQLSLLPVRSGAGAIERYRCHRAGRRVSAASALLLQQCSVLLQLCGGYCFCLLLLGLASTWYLLRGISLHTY